MTNAGRDGHQPVVLYEPDLLLCECLAHSLSDAFPYLISCLDARDFARTCGVHKDAIYVLDLSFADSLADGEIIVQRLLGSNARARFVVLLRHRAAGWVSRFEGLGARAVLERREITSARLADVIASIERGEPLVRHADIRSDQPLGDGASNPIQELSPREREVLAYVAFGADNLKIASCLGITVRTVRAHMSNLYKKLAMENRIQLALAARGSGIEPPPELA